MAYTLYIITAKPVNQKSRIAFLNIFQNNWCLLIIGVVVVGATGPNSDFVSISKHVSNNLQWVEIMNRLSKTNEVLGIALTGWSR